jgi:hypothetical protein
VGLKSAGSGTRSLKAVTGDYATSVRQEGHQMAKKVASLHAEIECFLSSSVSAHQVGNIYDTVSDICYNSFIFTGLVCLRKIMHTVYCYILVGWLVGR